MKAHAPGVLAASALVVLVGCGGRNAVTNASQFTKAATSVRLVAKDKQSGPNGRKIEIVCPDKVRTMAGTSSGDMEIVAVGSTVVGRTGDSGWIKLPMSFVNAPAVCAGSTWVPKGEDLATVIAGMTHMTVMSTGTPRDVNGIMCQDWEARERGPDPKGTNPRIRLCIGVDDQRLMELLLPDGTQWTFADWNSAIDISLPADAPQQ